MIAMKSKTQSDFGKVAKAAEKGAFKSTMHAAGAIRKFAIGSMRRAPVGVASKPGTPPNRHRGRLARAIIYAKDEATDHVMVGPAYSRIKDGGLPPWVGQMHEFGGEFGKKKKRKDGQVRGAIYPARPFMGPALEANLDRFAGGFAGSLQT